MTDKASLRPEIAEIFRRLEASGLRQRDLADALALDENKVSKIKSGERQLKSHELLAAMRWLDEREIEIGGGITVDANTMDYLPIQVLPTYAGMGGGGTGDGDRETALIPRSLIVHELRGRPENFLLVNVRGDSMEPDFRHGDQILIDRRDTSPSQPGPFALWDGEWGEYVIKNVERLPGGEVRIFSTNPKYTGVHTPADTTKIMGRPVWFGRRL